MGRANPKLDWCEPSFACSNAPIDPVNMRWNPCLKLGVYYGRVCPLASKHGTVVTKDLAALGIEGKGCGSRRTSLAAEGWESIRFLGTKLERMKESSSPDATVKARLGISARLLLSRGSGV